MPQMKSLRNFRLATTCGFVALVKADQPFHCPPAAVEDAMKAGCVPVNENDLAFAEAQRGATVEFSGGLRASTIYLAIDTLVKENKTKNFDAGGMPKVEVVSDRLGYQVSPAELRDLFQQYLSNKADGKDYELHPNAENIINVLSATTKAELIEMCKEFGIEEDQSKGANMAELRRILLVKFNGVTRE